MDLIQYRTLDPWAWACKCFYPVRSNSKNWFLNENPIPISIRNCANTEPDWLGECRRFFDRLENTLVPASFIETCVHFIAQLWRLLQSWIFSLSPHSKNLFPPRMFSCIVRACAHYYSSITATNILYCFLFVGSTSLYTSLDSSFPLSSHSQA